MAVRNKLSNTGIRLKYRRQQVDYKLDLFFRKRIDVLKNTYKWHDRTTNTLTMYQKSPHQVSILYSPKHAEHGNVDKDIKTNGVGNCTDPNTHVGPGQENLLNSYLIKERVSSGIVAAPIDINNTYGEKASKVNYLLDTQTEDDDTDDTDIEGDNPFARNIIIKKISDFKKIPGTNRRREFYEKEFLSLEEYKVRHYTTDPIIDIPNTSTLQLNHHLTNVSNTPGLPLRTNQTNITLKQPFTKLLGTKKYTNHVNYLQNNTKFREKKLLELGTRHQFKKKEFWLSRHGRDERISYPIFKKAKHSSRIANVRVFKK